MASSRTVMRVAAVLAVVVIFTGAYVMDQRRTRAKTEADLVAQLDEELAAPEALLALGILPTRETDMHLSARVLEIGRQQQGRIDPCLEMWPDAPDEVRIYVRADPAGRLEELIVEDCPVLAQACFLSALSEGRYTRDADGIATLPLRFR
ncbi:MAG TPA: hypothetical protein QGF58_14880 [Myxococcota bacterium]|nr:hypothetical protein [Myxococcota bacterium]